MSLPAVTIGECHPARYRAQDGWVSGQRAVVSPVGATRPAVTGLSVFASRLTTGQWLPKI